MDATRFKHRHIILSDTSTKEKFINPRFGSPDFRLPYRNFQLCPHLQPFYDLEISLGNTVEQVEEYAYTKCDLAVVFAKPLHFNEIEKQINLPSSVERWENKDTHYSIEAGYYCRACKHSIAGPN